MKVHKLDIKCNAILVREFKLPIPIVPLFGTGKPTTFENIRAMPYACGFVFIYLTACQKLGVDKKQEVVIELSKYDMERGATLAEVVYTCCRFMPAKELIDKSRVICISIIFMFLFEVHK